MMRAFAAFLFALFCGTPALAGYYPPALQNLGAPGPIGGVTPSTITGTTITTTTQDVNGVTGTASTPVSTWTGSLYTGGSATTTKPLLLIEPTGTTSNAWSTSGTYFGINGVSGCTGILAQFSVASSSRFTIQCDGTNIGTELRATTTLALRTDSGTLSLGSSSDVKVTRKAAANWRHGAASSASPAPQTVSVGEDSRSGTDSNVGGANGTIASGQGTGTGTLSTLILQSPIAVGSGTGAQTMTTGLTISNGSAVLKSYTVSTLPAACTDGALAFVTDATLTAITGLGVTQTGGGSNKFPVYCVGNAWYGI